MNKREKDKLASELREAGVSEAWITKALGLPEATNNPSVQRFIREAPAQPEPQGLTKPPELSASRRRSPSPPNGTIERREWLTTRETPVAVLAGMGKGSRKKPRRRYKLATCYCSTGAELEGITLTPSHGHNSTGMLN